MKRMMGSQLGSQLEGSQRELLDSRATNAPTPFIAIFDEFGYFMPEDAALMWAQARSLGFALVAAGQDLQAFFSTSREETMSIVANSNVKIFGRIEDPNETYDLVLKRAGEAYVTEMGGYEMNADSMIGGYRGNLDARHTKVNRIDLQDLVAQIEGEVHILVQTKLIRARAYYAVPEEHSKYEYRVNRFVRVLPPSANEVSSMMVDVSGIIDGLRGYPLAGQTADRWDGAIAGAAYAARHSAVVSKYREQRQGTELGIALFMAAVDGLDVASPPVTAAGSRGAGGGLVHTPIPSTETPDALLHGEQHSLALEGDELVFDGAAVVLQEQLTAFRRGREDDSDADAEAALYAAAAGALVFSAAGVDSGQAPELSFLNEGTTATALRGIAQALGADEGTAAGLAQQIAETVRAASEHPARPKPPASDEMEQVMSEALRDLADMVPGGGV